MIVARLVAIVSAAAIVVLSALVGPVAMPGSSFGIAIAQAGDSVPTNPVLSAKTAYEKAEAGQVVLIDIRHQDEWRETGVPKSGKAITLHQGQKAFLTKIKLAVGSDTSKPVALICASGSRSAYAQGWLRQQGFSRVYNVAEGMLGGAHGPGWIKTGLPREPWIPVALSPSP